MRKLPVAARPGLPRGQPRPSCTVSGFPVHRPGGTGFPACARRRTWGPSMRKPGMAARRDCGLWHAFCTAINRQARRKRMPWLAANFDLSSRRAACRRLYLLLTKHSFPSRLHHEPHGAQKRAKAHSRGLLQDHARVSFMVSDFSVHSPGGTGFPACARGGAGARGGSAPARSGTHPAEGWKLWYNMAARSP